MLAVLDEEAPEWLPEALGYTGSLRWLAVGPWGRPAQPVCDDGVRRAPVNGQIWQLLNGRLRVPERHVLLYDTDELRLLHGTWTQVSRELVRQRQHALRLLPDPVHVQQRRFKLTSATAAPRTLVQWSQRRA